jgi:hypothetical protein
MRIRPTDSGERLPKRLGQLPCPNHLEVALLPPVPPAHVAAVEPDYDRTVLQRRGLLRGPVEYCTTFLPTHSVLFRTVPTFFAYPSATARIGGSRPCRRGPVLQTDIAKQGSELRGVVTIAGQPSFTGRAPTTPLAHHGHLRPHDMRLERRCELPHLVELETLSGPGRDGRRHICASVFAEIPEH